MKAIKLILLTLTAFYSTGIYAQYNNYYLSDKVSGTGFTFIIDKDPDGRSSYYKIYNIKNVKFFMQPFTSIPTPPLAPGEEEPIYNRSFYLIARYNDINQVITSVRDGLGADIINQFKLLNNDGHIEIMFIVELNGTVSEVKFSIDSNNPLLPAIPPEKLYAVECLIKQRVTFTIQQRTWYPDFITGRNLPVTIKDL